jgi:hypothetical protein
MELYLPSLLVLVITALVILVILPNMSPVILVIVATLMLAITGYYHSSMFADEYATVSWQQIVYSSAGPFLVAMTVLLMLGFGLNFISGGASKPAIAPVAKMSTPPAYGANTLKSLVRDPFKTR